MDVANISVLDPAAQALQINLLALRNGEMSFVSEHKWKFAVESLPLRSRFEEAGLLEPLHPLTEYAEELRLIGHTWSVGHVFGSDVDVSLAVAEVAAAMASLRRRSSSAVDITTSDEETATDSELDEAVVAPRAYIASEDTTGAGETETETDVASVYSADDDTDASQHNTGSRVVEDEGSDCSSDE